MTDAQIHRIRVRGPLAWKVIDGALDMLPNSASPPTEAELVQWLDFFERSLRVYYDLPVGSAEAPKEEA